MACGTSRQRAKLIALLQHLFHLLNILTNVVNFAHFISSYFQPLHHLFVSLGGTFITTAQLFFNISICSVGTLDVIHREVRLPASEALPRVGRLHRKYRLIFRS